MWCYCIANTFLKICSIRSMLHKVSCQLVPFSWTVRKRKICLIFFFLVDTPHYFILFINYFNRKSSFLKVLVVENYCTRPLVVTCPILRRCSEKTSRVSQSGGVWEPRYQDATRSLLSLLSHSCQELHSAYISWT